MRENAASAANWLLIAFVVQVAAACPPTLLGETAKLVLLAASYLMNGWAAWRLRCPVALGAAIAGCALALLAPNGTDPALVGNMLVNLLFLLIYLPMQRGFDQKLRAADVSEQTLRTGRTWAVATLLQRGASMLGFLPLFAGQAEISAAQGQDTLLFRIQLLCEVAALIAAAISYIWMVRYLWRARRLLAEEERCA